MSCRCRGNRGSRRREEERNCFKGEFSGSFDECSEFDNWEDACYDEDPCCEVEDDCAGGRGRGGKGRSECLKEQPKRSNRSYIIGNSVNVEIGRCDTEVKAKIVVQERDSVRIWGQVVDCNNCPVPYALVKLLKEGCNCELKSVAHTMTDCTGCYQFDVCPERDGAEFVILAGKDAESRESVASSGIADNNCRCLCKNGPKPCHGGHGGHGGHGEHGGSKHYKCKCVCKCRR